MSKRNHAKALRDHFLDWQCRIRQAAMREDGGRPSCGMRPRVLDASGDELSPELTVLMIPKEPEETTALFRHEVMRTSDPRDVYERALTFLRADYFQDPVRFSDRLLTVLPADSGLAGALCDRGGCILAFEQGWRRYGLPCSVREAKNGSASREAAIWHNRLFNPALPDTVHVLDFHPDWASAVADPWPGGRKSHSP